MLIAVSAVILWIVTIGILFNKSLPVWIFTSHIMLASHLMLINSKSPAIITNLLQSWLDLVRFSNSDTSKNLLINRDDGVFAKFACAGYQENSNDNLSFLAFILAAIFVYTVVKLSWNIKRWR